MSVINTNVSSLIAQRALSQNTAAYNQSLERLSTGLKINTGADDPAGLIASQTLKSEQTGITTALDNASRANNVIGTAEGGLNEVSSLLTQLQGLISQAANTGGMSNDEISADQLQVDSILQTVNRLSQSTEFEGTKLLNGNFDYTTSGVVASATSALQVNSASIPDGGKVAVVVQVVTSAQTGAITYSNGRITGSTVTLEVAGNTGSEQLSFASGTSITSIATSINGVSTATGVSASVKAGVLTVNSTQYGSSQFVGLTTLSGTFVPSATKDYGTDADVTVNGAKAQTDGLHVTYRASNLDVSFDVGSKYNTNGTTKTFGIVGGGATFSLGAKVTEPNKASIGIQSVSTGSLGDSEIGFLSTLASGGANSLNSTNLSVAQTILDKAVTQVSDLRGRLGAFQKFTIGSTVNSLGVAYENVSAAESAIEDTDFATETSNLTRTQILSQAAQTVLSQANAAPQSALSLLRGA